ncbi:angiopoietin-4-like [Haliotis asinina]|uniref:angiopoietin-4-like n=1 Tax=Haliotis asinina TaxID=109174 RepID=UPI003531E5C5
MTYCSVLKMVSCLDTMAFYSLFMVFLLSASVEAAAETRSSLYTLHTATITNAIPVSIRSVTTASGTECLAQCVGVDTCTGVVYCPDDNVCYLMAATFDSVPTDTCRVYVQKDTGTQVSGLNHSCYVANPCANGGTPTNAGPGCSCTPSFTGSRCETRIEDCTDVSQHVSNSSGTYTVWPTKAAQPFDLECHGVTTMIMFRDKTISGCGAVPVTYLDVPWAVYKSGFSHSNCYMWLGLEKMHALTNVRPYSLYMSLKRFDTTPGQVSYDAFSVGDEASEYELSVSGFTGDGVFGDHFNLGDSAKTLDGSHFCAKDHCNNSVNLCADWHKGAWWNWLNDCQQNPHQQYDIYWILDDGTLHECKSIRMFIDPT